MTKAIWRKQAIKEEENSIIDVFRERDRKSHRI